jgi:hypothetical protein
MSQIVVECPIWKAILADDRLASARRKLSFHEIRLIIGHALASGTEAQRAETVEQGSVHEGAAIAQNQSDTTPSAIKEQP